MQPRAGIQRMSESASRKQALLKRHRRNKRISLLVGLLLLVCIGVMVAWWLPLLLAVVGWVAHEAWFADHLFYSPSDDYQYQFESPDEQPPVSLENGRLVLGQALELSGDETLVLALRLKSGWLGRFIDPCIELPGAIVRSSSAASMGCAT